jgi:hypothetical protein
MRFLALLIITLTIFCCTNSKNENMGLFDKLFEAKENPDQQKNKPSKQKKDIILNLNLLGKKKNQIA